MAETEQSTENRIDLKRDFLGVSDHKNLSAEGALRAPHTSTGRKNSESGDFSLSNSDRHLLHAAVAAENGGSGFILPSAQQTSEANPNSEASKRKREERHQTQLSLAEQARQLSERLGREIALMEATFEAQYGDAWREHIANKVMDPDDIPQRRDGETMVDYRQRLETVLIATMIDENGNIRPEYANSDDPDVRRYANWAQAQHTKRGADAYLEQRNDPSLSQIDREALDAEFRSSSSFAQIQQVASDTHTSSATANKLNADIDEQQEANASTLIAENAKFEWS